MSTNNYRISKLEIKNFRQHRNTKLEFCYNPQKMFAIILGDNGVGKTTIMNAITWCLYGKENVRYKDVGGFSIINDNALKRKPHGLVEMTVTLVLADKSGDKFKIERRLSLLNNGSNTMVKDRKLGIPLPKNSTPDITTSFHTLSKSGSERSEFFELKVGEILPEELSEYFLFDGEKLEDFFKNVENAKRGIERISQIDIVDMTLERLDTLRRKIKSNIKSDSPPVKQLQTELAKLETQKKRIEIEICEINDRINSTKRMIETLEQELANVSGDPGVLQRRMNEIKVQRTSKQNLLTEEESKLKDYVLNHMLTAQLYKSLSQTFEKIDQMYSKTGPLPPDYQKYFIENLLKKGQCICGNDISQDPARTIVEKLLEDKPYYDIDLICNELRFTLQVMLNVSTIKENLASIRKRILDYNNEMKGLQDEYDDLNTKIKEYGDQNIQEKYNKKKELEDEHIKLNQKLGGMNQHHCDVESEYGVIDEKFKIAIAKEIKHKILLKKLELCEEAQCTLKTTKTKLLDDFRQTVQTYTDKYFLNFLWKKNTFKTLIITSNYEIKVMNVDNTDVGTDILAMGEKLALALAFMAALRQITGFSFPLIIDSPLGKLGGSIRHNIARHLPKILHGHQVTLLVTDTEYKASDDSGDSFPSFENVLKNNVGTYYEIKNNDAGDSTIVNMISDYGFSSEIK